MRISDWSSDVCSSDLERGDVARRLAVLQPGHNGRSRQADAELPVDEVLRVAGRGSAGTDVAGDSRLPRGGRRDAGRHRAGFLAGVPALPHRRQGTAEIGRTSCRQRVCDYVWYTGVAVYYKKKRKSIK